MKLVYYGTLDRVQNHLLFQEGRIGDGKHYWAGEPAKLLEIHEHVRTILVPGSYGLALSQQFIYADRIIEKINRIYP